MRQPDGQLRSAVEPQSTRTAIRTYPPHRSESKSVICGTSSPKRPAKATSTIVCSKNSRSKATRFKGRVFDILGEVFEGTSLKELLIQAIRYGDQPEVRARLTRKIDTGLDHSHLKSLLDRNALAQETMSPERLYAVKEEMEKAEARRLQPYFVRSFFMKAFEQLGGSMYPRELGRFEITHVPTSIRERDRRITGRNRREQEPVLKRYDRICFEKEALQPVDKPGISRAVLMHPGHPLMLSVSDLLLEQHANLLRRDRC